MPIVSIIIPSYNHEDFIAEAVESCLSQSVDDLELIVVDDGSKDRSVPNLWTIDDPRLRIIEQSNQGAHAAINRGLSTATGDYLTILNSDDRFHKKRLEKLLDKLTSSKSDFVCSWLRQIDKEGKPGAIKEGWHNQLPGWAKDAHLVKKQPRTEFLEQLAHSNFISTTSNMLFTRRLYEKIGGMRNLRFCHDWDFALRAACQFDCTMIKESLLDYRTHGANTIHSNAAWMKFEVLLVMATHLKKVGEKLEEKDGKARNYAENPPLYMPGAEGIYTNIINFLQDGYRSGNEEFEERLMDNAELRKPFVEALENM